MYISSKSLVSVIQLLHKPFVAIINSADHDIKTLHLL